MNHLQPKYLFDCLDDVRTQLAACDKVAVFLDLDGASASLTPTSASSRLKPQTRVALQTLVHAGRYHVTVVSGRGMEDLRSIVNLSGITYAAKHGMEIAGPHVKFLRVKPAVSWNKGSAVKWILDQTGMDQPAAIYIGNHRTDEDVCRELPKSITVNVRRRRGTTSARYFVKSPDGVLLFLENLPLIEQSSRISRTLHSTLRAAIG